MAIYEYYCPTCRTTFEQRRPMAEAGTPSACAQGHRAERTISNFAVARGGAATMVEAPAAGGGCCGGGGCACSAN